MTNKPLNDTIHRVTQRVIANSRDSRSASSYSGRAPATSPCALSTYA